MMIRGHATGRAEERSTDSGTTQLAPSREGAAPAKTSAGWQRGADRLARGGFLMLTITIAFGLIARTAIVIVWQPDVDWTVYNRPYQIQGLGFLLVLLLSLPSLLAGAWDYLRGRWGQGSGRLLAFLGPAVVVVGTEGLVSHGLLGCNVTPWACPVGDFDARWHQFHHTLVAGLPLALLYWLLLRRYGPSLARRS